MLNIKNKETYTLAKELSKLTGRSMTVAVTEAVREKLIFEKNKRQKKKHKIAKELLKIGQKFSEMKASNDNR